MPDPISKVLTGGLCAGCGGCAAVAPDVAQMRLSTEGFLRPRFSHRMTARQQDTLSQICPSVRQTCEPRGRLNDPIWGPYVSAKIGFSQNQQLRHQAASGGALSGFLTGLLENGDVDGVIHVVADPADPLGNVTTISTTAAEILHAAGSRYAPSSPLDALPRLLGDARRYAFVGKPCDVSALFALRQQDPELAQRVPVLVSFFCAGVPSLKGGRDILARMGVAPSEVSAFRHRAAGWPGRATADLRDGTQRSLSYEESWGGILSKAVQHRCKICADGSGVFADVVFADAWDANADGYPSFEDRPGQSLVLSRTVLGHTLVTAAERSGHLAVSPYDLGALAAIQPGQTRRRRVLLARLAALWLIGRPIPRYRGMGLWAMARHASLPETLRNFGGTIRRGFWRSRRAGGPSC